jgi:hypothetical protein
MQPVIFIITNDGTLAHHRKLYHGHHPTEALHGLHPIQAHKMENY